MLKKFKKLIATILIATLLLGSVVSSLMVTAETTETDKSMSNFVLSYGLRGAGGELKYDATEGGYILKNTARDGKHSFFMSPDNYFVAGTTYKLSVEIKDITSTVGIVFGAQSIDGTVNGAKVECSGITSAFKAWVTPASVFRVSSCDKSGGNPGDVGPVNSGDKNFSTTEAALKADDWNLLEVEVAMNSTTYWVNGVQVYQNTTNIKNIGGYAGIYSSQRDAAYFRNFKVTYTAPTDTSLSNFKLSYGLRGAGGVLTYDATVGGYILKNTARDGKHSFFMSPDYNLKAGSTYKISVELKDIADSQNLGIVFGAQSIDGTINGAVVECSGISSAYKAWISNTSILRSSSCDKSGGNPGDVGPTNTGNQNFAATDGAYKTNDWNLLEVVVSSDSTVYRVNGVDVCTSTTIKNIGGYVGIYSSARDAGYFRNFKVVTQEPSMSDFVLSYGLRGAEGVLAYDLSEGGYYLKNTTNDGMHSFFMSPNYNFKAGDTYKISVEIKNIADGQNLGIVFGAESIKGTVNGKVVECAGISSAYKAWISNASIFRVSACNKSGGNPGDVGTPNSGNKDFSTTEGAYKTDDWNLLEVEITADSTTYSVNGTVVYTDTTNIKNIGGYVGVYSRSRNAGYFRNFKVEYEESKEPSTMDEFVLSNSLRGTSENTSLVYNSELGAYSISTTASNPQQNYFMCPDYNLTAGSDYTVSFDFKGTVDGTIPRVGLVIGASSINGVAGTNDSGDAITSCEGLASAYYSWIYFDANDGWNCNTFRMNQFGTTTGTGRVRFLAYNENDWNTMTVKVTAEAINYYMNGKKICTSTAFNNIGGYVGFYSQYTNAIFKNFTVKETVELDVAIDPTKTIVACVGDSITFGYGSGAHINYYSYPAQLQERLGDKYEVLNYGVSGKTALNGLNDSYTNCEEYSASLATNPDIVIIMLGTNDANKYWADYSGNYEADLAALITSYKNLDSAPSIYLCTTPYSLKAELNTTILNELVPIQQKLANEYGCELISMYAFLEGKDTLFADELHPTSNGYSVLADKFYNAITDSVYGDVNGDKVIDARDIVRMKKVVAELEGNYIRANADIDFDGGVSATDIATLRKHLLSDMDNFGEDKVESTISQLSEEMSSIG